MPDDAQEFESETEATAEAIGPEADPAIDANSEARLDARSDATRESVGVLAVPIDVTVSVGRARPLISELIALRRDSVLPLDSRLEDPVEIFVGSRLIARGELQELDGDGGGLGVRLTEVVDLSDGV